MGFSAGELADDDLVTLTPQGLYCAQGGFHIDPWGPVERAVITHAHADHARPGSKHYLCASRGERVLRHRLGPDAEIQTIDFGQAMRLGDVRVSLHPAGHVLGSAQVRIEPTATPSPTWVITGDYKRDPDPTCDAFEPVRCDVFLTESTFGLPIYHWPDPAIVSREINAWWAANTSAGRTSLIAAYSLGKAQRVLALLDPAIAPIGLHGAVVPLTDAYRETGIDLPPCVHANRETSSDLRGRALIIAPPSALASPWSRRFSGPDGSRTAMASGWMRIRGRRRWRAFDRGFVLSDHADWNGLLATIQATGAERVGITHGYADTLARYLAEERGLDTFVVPTRFSHEADTDAEAETEEEAPR